MAGARTNPPAGAPGEEFAHISNTVLWQCVCEISMRSVFHAIGSRVSALSGIATMAGMGEELDGTLLSLLEGEVELLTEILQASRALPRAPREGGGPCLVAELMPGVVQLLELSLETRGIDIDYDGPDSGGLVELGGTALTHSLATLLTCLSWRASSIGATTLRVRLRIEDASIEVTGSLEGAANPDHPSELQSVVREHDTPSAEVIERGMRAIAALASTCGGSLEALPPQLPERFRLHLPALRG